MKNTLHHRTLKWTLLLLLVFTRPQTLFSEEPDTVCFNKKQAREMIRAKLQLIDCMKQEELLCDELNKVNLNFSELKTKRRVETKFYLIAIAVLGGLLYLK